MLQTETLWVESRQSSIDCLRAQIHQDLSWQDEAGNDREAERALCASDVTYFCDRYITTYDPRRTPQYVPFTLFPRQREFLEWVAAKQTAGEGGLVEKSRDSGLTWLCCVYALHQWLFKGPVAIGFGSSKLELVDKIGDPKSVLEKIRVAVRRLPAWMLPRGFDEGKHLGYCKLVNPETGATITGEGGDQIGRGGRCTLFFVDEAAFIEHPTLVDAALSNTTNCRIDVSTPNGPGNEFYRKRFSGKLDVFTFSWRSDPRKDDAWYAHKQAELDPVIVAQEIDIDYTASIEGICIPALWVRAAVGLELPMSGPRTGGYDVADEGANKNVLIGRQGPVVFKVKDWQHMNTTQSAHRSKEIAEEIVLETLNYDVVGVGAGIKGSYESMEKQPVFKVVAVNTGESPTDTLWPDSYTSKEKFLNLRAEAWWTLRRRFEKTYEHFVGSADDAGNVTKITHPLDELISLPNHSELIAQLSQPRYFRMETGKIKIESKDDMRRRSVKSPDYADALVLAFIPKVETRVGIVRWDD